MTPNNTRSVERDANPLNLFAMPKRSAAEVRDGNHSFGNTLDQRLQGFASERPANSSAPPASAPAQATSTQGERPATTPSQNSQGTNTNPRPTERNTAADAPDKVAKTPPQAQNDTAPPSATKQARDKASETVEQTTAHAHEHANEDMESPAKLADAAAILAGHAQDTRQSLPLTAIAAGAPAHTPIADEDATTLDEGAGTRAPDTGTGNKLAALETALQRLISGKADETAQHRLETLQTMTANPLKGLAAAATDEAATKGEALAAALRRLITGGAEPKVANASSPSAVAANAKLDDDREAAPVQMAMNAKDVKDVKAMAATTGVKPAQDSASDPIRSAANEALADASKGRASADAEDSIKPKLSLLSQATNGRASAQGAAANADNGPSIASLRTVENINQLTTANGQTAPGQSAQAGTQANAMVDVAGNLAPAASAPQRAEGAQIPKMLVPTPAGQRAWAEDVSNRVIWIAGRGEGRAELVLTPPSLGKLRVTIQTNGDQTTAHFVAASSAAREALEQALPRLREALQQAGINLGDTSVSTSSQNQAQQGHDEGQKNGERARAMEYGILTNTVEQADGIRRSFAAQGLVDIFA